MIKLSSRLIELAKNLNYPLYVVGGYVRDYLAGLNNSSDIDICAPASAEDFALAAKNAGYTVDAQYKNTGTLKFSLGQESYEFASFRSDKYVRGEHTPADTFFTSDINLDARRRDFKCNAVYYDIAAQKIVDPLGGVKDIQSGVISTVAPAEKVFGEDGLRLMRLARIAAQTGFKPSPECLKGATLNAGLIRDVSVERIYAELNMILHADGKYGKARGQYEGLKILQQTGVLQIILPELSLGEGMSQRPDIHKYDVLEHTFRTVAYSDDGVRLAALLHDIGKPYCFINFGKYYGHETEGARIAKEVCSRLKVPKKLAEETVKLVELHMYDMRCDAKENKVRKFIIENYAVIDKLLLLKQADFSACADDFGIAPTVEKFNAIIGKMREEGVPFNLKELNVRGDELIALGLPAASVGSVLQSLLKDCAINAVKNEKELLLSRAQKMYLTVK